ncbi:MAG: hypothetical protein GTO51_09035 [Candidatus Latescibacteria bacterium]|nr:hypothetical protein [Candidatus Latescibacterota bacterium]NIM22096.1 hypothetical protein [Candidatus Latescibacterota bacterium]NIM66115.1 hypothetical protein [Candidatus Latescibacterota bacterium]NIO02523.1 hypothetical protein [Candidatus Latescibacterota bacterium]NIO29434.1 hypothetical protein [Candidatus Latescibacterota bacterium]
MDHYLVLGILGGALALDDRAGWQSLVAQPIFISLIVGYIFGEISSGLIVGLFLELIWLAVLPMRGTRRPDQVCGAIVGSASACFLVHTMGDPRFAFVISLGVLSGLLAGEFASRLSMPLQHLKEQRLSRIAYLRNNEDWRPVRNLFWVHLFATAYTFFMEVLVVLLFLAVGYAFSKWVSSSAGESVVKSIEHWGLLFPAFGVASLIHVYWHKHLTRFLLMSTVLILVVLWTK